MNEAETRAEHIDPALQAAGWGNSGDNTKFRDKVSKGYHGSTAGIAHFSTT